MPESLAGSIKAAAIQLEAIVGDVTTNLSRLELMIREAAEHGAKLMEVMTVYLILSSVE